MTPKNFLKAAVCILGGQDILAKSVGVSKQSISYWLQRKNGFVPAEAARSIENATGGRITRIDLRPDLFGDGFKNAHGLNSGTIPVAGLAENNGGVPSAVQKGV